jgi:hypothetical protein
MQPEGLSQTKGNRINNFDFLKFVISLRGGHCYYSLRMSNNLATPLIKTHRDLNEELWLMVQLLVYLMIFIRILIVSG